MIRNTFIVLFSAVLILVAVNLMHRDKVYNLKLEKLKQRYTVPRTSSVDHTKLPALNREFKTPQEVTIACISCHTERPMEIIQSSHWNWERVSYIEGRGIAFTGKKNALNNFCIGARTNEQSCAKCHIGFGMTGENFDFSKEANVDCMVCHDNSEEYLKGSALAGYPDRSVHLTRVARSVGRPQKSNCGACHFYSGGGNNVKHGDLEEAQIDCSRDVDVHMASVGMNMTCVDCHTAEQHIMLGKLYSVSSENVNRATCEQCHTSTPHHDKTLNRHGDRVSCQACHIPIYAKENATKMAWRWSRAGKLKDGKPFHVDNADGNHTYLSEKGEFVWEKNVVPEYVWFNGTADHYLLGDKVTNQPVQMNTLNGSYEDRNSKIIPVKVHRGDQIYDKKNNILVQPMLYGPDETSPGFWKSFDWDKAASAGMKRVGLPYSGDYEFVETEMYWPINHMVSPAAQTVPCQECHTRSEDGRLASLGGFYLPGRDRNFWLDLIGILAILGAILGVSVHATGRIVMSWRKNRRGGDNL